MSEPTLAAPSAATHRSWRRAIRWLPTFAAFPLGSVAAKLAAGPIDNLAAAVVGGLISGAAIGAAQAWAIGRGGPGQRSWIVATTVGMTVGLTVGTASVGYATSTAALVAQGAVCGAAVGAAQAVALSRHLGRLALVWPAVVSALWALGWLVTASIGVDVDQHFTVFGSSGALLVTVGTSILPVLVPARSEHRS